MGQSRTLEGDSTTSQGRSQFFPLPAILPASVFQIKDDFGQYRSDTSRRSKDNNETLDILELALSILMDDDKSSMILPATRDNDDEPTRNGTNDSKTTRSQTNEKSQA